jgi:hypothetical protein
MRVISPAPKPRMRTRVLRLLVFEADRLATCSSDLQGEAAVLVLMPDRRVGFGADLAGETLVDER